jgi:hypothetical protein
LQAVVSLPVVFVVLLDLLDLRRTESLILAG